MKLRYKNKYDIVIATGQTTIPMIFKQEVILVEVFKAVNDYSSIIFFRNNSTSSF